MRQTARQRLRIAYRNFLGALALAAFVIAIGLPGNIRWISAFGWTKAIGPILGYSVVYAVMIYTIEFYDATSSRKMSYRSSRTLARRRFAVVIGTFCGVHLLGMVITIRNFDVPGQTTWLWASGIALVIGIIDYFEQRNIDRRPRQSDQYQY